MRTPSKARRLALTVLLIAALVPAAVGSAQAEVCGGLDCGGGDVASGPQVQYTFSTFAPCTECSTSMGRQTTAYLDGVQHPPAPIVPPSPASAFAEGKLLVPGPNGAEQILAIGRIYQFGAEYLFDGHLVPGAQHPPAPIRNSLTFRGIIFQ